MVQLPPSEWWEILAGLSPVAVLLAAVLAFTVGLMTLRQRTRADRRSDWWDRAEWALDASMSDDPVRMATGLNVLSVLAESELASAEEIEILTAAWQEPLAEAAPEGGRAGVRGGVPTRTDRSVHIAAARLRKVTDKRLGRATPEWVRDLAAGAGRY